MNLEIVDFANVGFAGSVMKRLLRHTSPCLVPGLKQLTTSVPSSFPQITSFADTNESRLELRICDNSSVGHDSTFQDPEVITLIQNKLLLPNDTEPNNAARLRREATQRLAALKAKEHQIVTLEPWSGTGEVLVENIFCGQNTHHGALLNLPISRYECTYLVVQLNVNK